LADLIELDDEQRRAQARALMERIVRNADELKGVLGG
jgi:hypothetical protein